jgi:hypothetical protein
MASSKITLSVDRENYLAARAEAERMDTTVSHMTNLFFQSLASRAGCIGNGRASRLRGAFASEEADESHRLVRALKSKHL